MTITPPAAASTAILKHPKDHLQRGNYTVSWTGKITFFITRLVIPAVLAWIYYDQNNSGTTSIALLFSLVAALRQIYWLFFLSDTYLPVSDALSISLANLIFDAGNLHVLSLMQQMKSSTTEASSSATIFYQWSAIILFITGSTIETFCEINRFKFKKDVKSKGKIFTGHLFSIARHINYTGYLMWRTGFALWSGSGAWGMIMFGWNLGFFLLHSIPCLDDYMSRKYKVQWEKYKRETPYKLIPYIV